ncbi:MAG: chloride channel protein [Lentisphaeria bacterium]|nr:chloride channel protein [Lentisphaeria bacterium]
MSRHFLSLHRFSQEVHLWSLQMKRIMGAKGYVLLLCVIVGVVSGLAAVLLKTFTHEWHDLLYSLAGKLPGAVWILPALPAAGIFLCIIFVRLFFNRRPYEKSLAGVITSTTNGTGDLPAGKMFSHIITSGIAVGAGASAGLEAPIALTGSAIGSNFAKWFRLDRESRILLLACGGGAGISAIFNSPVAGALFACEILLPSFSVPALVPLLMASAAAAVVSELCRSYNPFIQLTAGWTVMNVPWYVFIGVAAGLLSALVIRTSVVVAKRAEKQKNVWLKGLYGCVVLYLIFLLLPALKGEGYRFIMDLIRGNENTLPDGGVLSVLFRTPWSLIVLTVVLMFVKPFVSALSVESGGDGGIFGPSLFTGAFLGYAISKFLNLTGIAVIDPVNCIAVGMGGVLAGVMHAPLTGMFLIAELTGGYRLFVPLMIVVALSSFISKRLVKHNVYKSMIVLKGGIPEQRDDEVMLTNTRLCDLVEADYPAVHENDTLRGLLKTVMASTREIFPVVSDDGRLVGIVRVDSLRKLLLNSELYDMVLVYDVMSETGPVLDSNDTLNDAVALFDRLRSWHLPVTEDGKYLGFVSKLGVYDRYRRMLREKHDLF